MKSEWIIFICLIVVIAIAIFSINKPITKPALVVKVNEQWLDVIALDENKKDETDSSYICRVNFSEDGDIGFKKGQEILIYFDGIIQQTHPASIPRS